MLNWLMSDWQLFGLSAQNWMWVLPGAVVLYLALLTLVRRRTG